MSIIGQEIESYTISQINARQKLHGSGTSTSRTPQQISVLNSNSSWVKLASGVKIDKSKLTELGLPTSLDGMELAKNNVLFGGTSKLVGGQRLQQKEGFLPYQSNSSYSHGDFGYSPMPGIISADIKALNRGSLKKATVRFKVHNKQQFDIVDVLYMRLGYTVLLEWGNSMYTSNGTDRQLVQQTIVEDSVRFFSPEYEKGKSYRDMLPVIEFYRNKYDGNYDGLLGKVSNFNWTFQSDGSYDIEITIISLGDVVESLKTNVSSNKQLSLFIENTLAANPSGSEGENNLIEENADSNDIAAMLYCWKYVNKDLLTYQSYEDSIYIKRPDIGDRFVGAFLETSTTITSTSATYRFAYLAYGYDTEIYPDLSQDTYYKSVEISYDISVYPNHEEEAQKENRSRNDKLIPDGKETLSFVDSSGYMNHRRVSSGYESLGNKKTTIDSPLTNFNKKDACFINTEPNKQFYLRFGALLTYLKTNIIPKVNTSNPKYNSKPPIFNINTDVYGTGKLGNYMYSLPNQISLDPRICIVRNDKFQTTSGITEVYKHLTPFRAEDYVTSNPNPNKAYIMNIYLNFEFIINCINDNLDEKGDIGIFGFLKAICDGLNKSLGGINNLEPIIKEESNTLYIIDTTPIPGIGSQTVPYTLQLFGYNASTSNFVRNVDLKTAITPEYATMITVGATAGGYVKGTESTAFSKWNTGLKDRFQEEFIPGNENSSKEGDEDEAASNYTNKFLSAKAGSSSRYGFKGDIVSDNAKNLQIDPGAIEKNISVVTEYYKYLIASQKNQQGGTVGFIPFKLNFSLDGISGIKIYNKLHVDTRFLPKAYGTELDLIVTGVSHKLSNNDWETDIETTLIPKTNELKDLVITAEAIVEDINNNPPTNASSDAVSETGDFYEKLRKHIKGNEGFKTTAAWDIANWRIGYGTQTVALNSSLTGNDKLNPKNYISFTGDRTKYPIYIDLDSGKQVFHILDKGHVKKYATATLSNGVIWRIENSTKDPLKGKNLDGYVKNSNGTYSKNGKQYLSGNGSNNPGIWGYTEKHAQQAFEYDIRKKGGFESKVKQWSPEGYKKLTDEAKIALIDLAYNYGSIVFDDVRNAIKSGSSKQVALALAVRVGIKAKKKRFWKEAKYVNPNVYNELTPEQQQEAKNLKYS